MPKLPMTNPESLVQQVLADLQGLGAGRKVIAVAGPPAAGKSTFAAALVQALPGAYLVPMDGFHLDNRILEARGLLARKGAPETFDSEGFVHLVGRIASGGEVVYPVFDRDRDIAIAGAGVVPASADMVIVEGNYLLLDQAPWDRLAPLWSRSIWLDVPRDALADRLLQRWQGAGLSEDAARARRDGNDMVNADLIRQGSRAADITLGR